MACFTYKEEQFKIEDIRRTATEGKLLSMEIEFSQLCNFKCPYCYLESHPGQTELSASKIRSVILQAKDLGAQKIIVLGGEPMIFPGILEQLAFIRESGLAVEMFTNGSNIDADSARRLASLDVKVVLKLNSRDASIQNRLCGRNDAFDIINDALRNLLSAGYGHGGKPMAISSVICRDNLDEILSLWSWARKQDIEPYLEMVTPQGGALKDDWVNVSVQEYESIFKEIAEMDSKVYGFDWKPQPPLVGNRCLRHLYSVYMNSFGDVMPCVGINIAVGSVKNSSLKDIVADSEVLQDLRGFRKKLKGPCATCKEVEFCYGCRGAAYQMTGDYLASDPLCWHNAERLDEIDYLPIAVVDYIPHKAPMQIVDVLRMVGEREAFVEAVIPPDSIFVDDQGRLESEAFVELIAQAAAAHNGFRMRHLKEPMQGYLLGIKNLEILSEVHVGDHLDVHVYKEARFGDFGIIKGWVKRGELCVAQGEIKVFHKKSGMV